MKQTKLFTSLVAILFMLLPVSMMAQITVAVDNTSTFVPTQIVNGDFGTRPFMPFKYNDTWYNTWNSSNPNAVYWTEVNPNGIGEGWNTTETQVYDHGLFEWVSGMNVYNSTLNTNGNNNGHGYFLEMNACNSAVLYQDLPTNGHDVIRWSLQHAVRTGSWADPQSMRVEIGAPQRDGSNNIVAASGVNEAVDAKIIASTKATYNASGYSGYNGYAGDYSGLSLPISYNTQWYTVTGVYSIPQGQDVTRFAFTATSTYNAGGGNLLDNITFSTIFGNLSAHQVEGDAVELKGYWGESDAAKTMKVVIGSTTHTVDMSSVRGHSFTITIPAATIGSENALTVYHQDYYDARLTIYIAPTYSVELASGTANASDWSLSPTSAKSGLTVAINYNGTRTVKDVTVGRNITSTIEFNNSNASTAINNFNNTPQSKLLFTSDYSLDLTVTRAEGEIDLNGHTSTGAIFTQNNQYGYSLTIKNGTLKGVDGAIGWSNWYSGTLIFDNVTMSESLWTDGHDVIIKSGTFSAVQNYKRGDTPGTVTIYGGNISAFNTTGVSAPTYHGTYTLYGGKYAFDPRGITAYTVIIPTGYAVQANTESDAGTYPWKVVNTNPSYAVEFENVQVVNDHQWTFTMPPYDVMVAVEYAVASVTVGETTTNYSTFSSALSAWVNNSTLKLLADVEISSTINVSNTRTLDLNGFGIKMLSSIYGGAASPGSVFLLNTTGAYLTILDSNPTTTHYYTITDAATNGAGLAKVVDQATYNSALGTKGTFLGGYITGGRNTDDNAYGAGVHLNGNNCRLDIYGGTIIGNELIGNTTGGGGVQIEGSSNNAKFYMYGGNIIGNRAAYGGAVYIRSGHAEFHDGLMKYNIAHQTCGGAVHAYGNYSTFVMSGGTLSNNKAACGGALEASGSGTITLTGGSIVNNLATERGGALTNRRVNDDTHNAYFNLSGNVLISGNTRNSNAEQIFLCNTVKLNITGALSNTTSIGVAMTTPGVFTTGYNSYNSTTHPSTYFHSENAGYIVGRNTSGEAYLHIPYTVTYNGNGNDGGTVPTDAATYAGGVTVSIPSGIPTKTDYAFTGWLNSVNSQTYTAGNFTITDNTTLTAQWAPAVASVTVGVNTTNYATFSEALSHWENNSTLTLLANVEYGSTIEINNTRILDLNGYGIKRTGTGRVILLNGSGNLTINDSNSDAAHKFTVTNAYGDAGLGVVNDDLTSGYQTFHGGYITGGNGVDHGAGIENDATNGVVTINGGVFIGNRSTTHGGFYWGHTNKTLNMNGGRIIYNMTACQGAAIFIGNATMRLYGGEISHNYSTGSGRAHSGGICSAGNNNLYMHGAPIVTANIGGNSATNQPNDICLESKIRIDGGMTNATPIGIMMNLGGYDGTTRGQFSYDSEFIDNSTSSHFVGQNYGDDEPVRIGNALWMWNPVRDTHGTVAYQVTYDSRGGSVVTGQTVLSGEKASQPENPIKAGHTFVAWYKDVLLTDAWNFASDVITADVTLHARYAEDVAFPINITATTTDAKGGWYLIASPIGAVSPSSVNNMTSNDYDIFRFNQNPTITGDQYLEWENWNQAGGHNHFNLEPGRGYLYANSEDVDLTFIGTPYSGNGQVSLNYSEDNPDSRMHGWNLIGNPFGVKATIGDKPFYRINSGHTGIIVRNEEEKDIAPMEGIFVHADNDGEIVIFSTGAKRETASVEDRIVINLSDNKGIVVDRAIVSFDKGYTLPKFQIRDNSTKLYIPQNGVDYAIAFAYRIGELPLNFKAQETGVYTLNFSGENMTSVSLVDMIEGVEIDLSVNDKYTFIGTATDREDRFKLVFSSLNDSNLDIFAYQTGNEIVVSGEGTLEVFDVMGRMVMQQRIDGLQTVTQPLQTGVYIFRLNEKVQKIVVR